MEMPQIKFAIIAIKSNKLGQKPGEGTLSDTKSDFLYHTNTKYLLNQLIQFNSIQVGREVPWAPRSSWGSPSRSHLNQGFSA